MSLEVPIKGRPVTTMEVSVKNGENKGNTQNLYLMGKTCEYACMNNF